jgi:hypothetical protein
MRLDIMVVEGAALLEVEPFAQRRGWIAAAAKLVLYRWGA